MDHRAAEILSTETLDKGKRRNRDLTRSISTGDLNAPVSTTTRANVRFHAEEKKKKKKSKEGDGEKSGKKKSRRAKTAVPPPKMLKHLSSDFFSSFMEELTKDSELNVKEPTLENIVALKSVPAQFETMNNLRWLTAGSLEQMVEFVCGPAQSKCDVLEMVNLDLTMDG